MNTSGEVTAIQDALEQGEAGAPGRLIGQKTSDRCRNVGTRIATSLVLTATLFLTGCVSAKYKMMPGQSVSPSAFDLNSANPAASATLRAVVVFHGPGSWKKDAYWDEYILTISNPDERASIIESVILTDGEGHHHSPGTEPWNIEKTSRQRLKVAKHTGRDIALGAGVTAAWFGSAALIASNITIWGGAANAGAVAAGTAGFVGIPLVALGSGIRTMVARHAITKEFNRRRLNLPRTLAAGAIQSGSLFFPVTPGPRSLQIRLKDGDGHPHTLVLELAPLAELHLKPALKAR